MDYIVAIDGPSGSGKSTLAREIASRLGGEVLDTGAMYRSVAWHVIENQIDPADAEAVANSLQSFSFRAEPSEDSTKFLVGSSDVLETDVSEAIRTPEVTKAASVVAANQQVRQHLQELQRKWAKERGGGVVEGRDIGTDVFPDAKFKFYLTATSDERASRRAEETGADKAAVLTSQESRDTADKTREHSPLRVAPDAVEIDTTSFTVSETADKVMAIISTTFSATEVSPSQDTTSEEPPPQDQQKFTAYDFPAAKHYGKKRSPGNNIFYRSARRACILIGTPYMRQRIKHRHLLPATGPVIVAPGGHRSNLDTILVGMAVKRSPFYMAKDSLFKSGFWSSFVRAFGGFPVARDKLDRRALETALKVLERGEVLIVFPEGARQEGPKLQPLFVGVAWLAAKSGAPVVPIGIGGSQKVMPIGKIMPRPHRIRMILGEPIAPPAKTKSAKESRQARDAFTQELTEKLQALFDEAQVWAGTPNRP